MAKKAREKAVIETRNLEIKVLKKGESKKKQAIANILMFIIKIVIVLVIIYALTSAKKITVNEAQNLTIPQTKVVQEPYQVVEEYQEKEPYGTQYCVNRPMNFSAEILRQEVGSRNQTLLCAMNLTNLENVEGTWIYDAYLESFSGRAETPELSKTVDAGAIVTFSWEIELPPNAIGANCVIFMKSLPSTKKCFYPEPITYRIVTKTRTVTKYRNVTTTEESAVTNMTTSTKFINRIFGYEQGFYFGW